MSKSFSSKEAVCQYMGWSYEDANDYRYHYGLTSIPIYSTATGYVCATANGKKVPKRDIDYITNGCNNSSFVEAKGSMAEYCKSRGKTVWICDVTE